MWKVDVALTVLYDDTFLVCKPNSFQAAEVYDAVTYVLKDPLAVADPSTRGTLR